MYVYVYVCIYMEMSINGDPKNGWFLTDDSTKMELGGPISGNLQIYTKNHLEVDRHIYTYATYAYGDGWIFIPCRNIHVNQNGDNWMQQRV